MKLWLSGCALALLVTPVQAAHCPHGQFYRVHLHQCVEKGSSSSLRHGHSRPPEDIMHGDDGRPPIQDAVVYPKNTATPRDGSEGPHEVQNLPDAFVRSIMKAPPMKWMIQ
jgi:hypothetical protein